jgi:hypothetical protein
VPSRSDAGDGAIGTVLASGGGAGVEHQGIALPHAEAARRWANDLFSMVTAKAVL